MKNEIYRGKRINNGRWIFGFYYHDITRDGFNPDKPIIFEKDIIRLIEPEGMFLGLEVIPDTICQYIGISDKSGEKLFTGDIVQVCNSEEDYSKKLVITFEDGAFCLRIPGTTDFSDAVTFRDALDQAMQKGQVPIYEKLGNVFDNQIGRAHV